MMDPLSLSLADTVHRFDAVLVGAGGAGLRAALGLVEQGFKTACLSKGPLDQTNTAGAKGGFSAALGSMEPDDWRWHWYDTIKSSDWLGDQDAIEFLCRQAEPAALEMAQYGLPFLRTDDGGILQRPMGGMTGHFGETPIRRNCAVKNGAGPALLETLYRHCTDRGTAFFFYYFALDLIMVEGRCHGVSALDMRTGTVHLFEAQTVILATGGYGRAYPFSTGSPLATGDGNGMALRAGLPLQDMAFVQFHPTGIYGSGQVILEGARAEGGILKNADGERFMARYAPQHRELAARDVVSRAMVQEISAGRGIGPKQDHLSLHLEHLDPKRIQANIGHIAEVARAVAGIDITRTPVPVIPTVHYTMGGIPTTRDGAVLDLDDDGSERVVPGLMAIGECACVSVHGANRLGSNSLLDLLVFGRAAAARCAETLTPGKAAPLPPDAGSRALERPRTLLGKRNGESCQDLMTEMQDVMQRHAGVFRDGKTLAGGWQKMMELFRRFDNVGVGEGASGGRLPALVEVLALDNLRGQALITLDAALRRTESRGSHARSDFPERDDATWARHSLTWLTATGALRRRYRPVRPVATDSELAPLPPQKRVY